jgi:hypothetical protein
MSLLNKTTSFLSAAANSQTQNHHNHQYQQIVQLPANASHPQAYLDSSIHTTLPSGREVGKDITNLTHLQSGLTLK